MTSEVDRVLAEAAEKIRREGYAAGWRDALAALAKAAEEITSLEIGDVPYSAPEARRARDNGNPPANLPLVGTTPHFVYMAVKAKPGMSGADVVLAVQSAGHTAPEAQIRTALSRLEKRRLLVNRHKKWFLM